MRRLRAWSRHLLRGVPGRAAETRIRGDVRAELQAHLALRTEALEREGVPPAEARARAEREFGDIEDAAAYCAAVDRAAARKRTRRAWWLELRQDAAHAVRLLRRSPGFAVVAVSTLAVGAAAGTTFYTVLDAYLLRPLPFPAADRLMWVEPAPTRDFPRAPSLADVDWRFVEGLVDAAAMFDLDGFAIRGEPYAEVAVGAWVSPGFFRAFDLVPAIGRGFTPDEYRAAAPVALLSHELWVRRFGRDPNVVGTVIEAHSSDRPEAPHLLTVVGVLPAGFWPLHWRTSDLLRPLGPENGMPQLVRLRAGMTRHEAQARLDDGVRRQLREAVDPAWRMALVPALERHSAAVRPLVLALFGAAAFMFLSACASVAGALVGRTAGRRGELALRAALGGSRGRLLRQLVTESAVLTAIAGAVGVALAWLLLATAGPFIERQLGTGVPGGPTALRPTLRVAAQALAIITTAGAALGVLQALTALGMHRARGLPAMIGAGRGATGGSGGMRTRRILIAAQVSVATVLLFGAGLMIRTVARISTSDLGFRTEGIVTGAVLLPEATYPEPADRRRLMDVLLSRLAVEPGVVRAAAVFPPPFWWPDGFPVFDESTATTEEAAAPRANVYTVSPEYFDAMGIETRAGRILRATDDHASPLVVVISETLARRIAPARDAIGRRIRVRVPHLSSFADVDTLPWRTVVGVVADTRESFAPDARQPLPDVYVPYAQNPRARHALVVHTDRAAAAMIGPIRRAIAHVDPSLALDDAATLDDLVAQQTGRQRSLGMLLATFAVFGLGLAVLALYSSLTSTVAQRRTELAVRIAIGAGPLALLRHIAGEGLLVAAAGGAAGIAAALALGRVLRNQLFGVDAADPATLLATAVLLALTAVAACTLPGLRAARTDPARALRE